MRMSAIEAAIAAMAREARCAARAVARASTEVKNAALKSMAAQIMRRADDIRAENEKDLTAARAAGLPPAMIDRLTVSAATISAMAAGLGEVAALADPVGRCERASDRADADPSGRDRDHL